MRVRVGCEFEFESDDSVPMLMLVRARPDVDQHASYESHWVDPSGVRLREYVDGFGNRCWRLKAPRGLLHVRYDAVIEVPSEPDPVVPDAAIVPVDELPPESLVFTLPSRYVQSDLMLNQAWELFGKTPQTWARVQAIVDWVHTNVRYETGNSSPMITAMDVLERRVGVCRDFALMSVALCRAMNIPARYTFGYLPDIDVEPPDVPMDFHAWFEAFLGGRWHTFDARHNQPRVGRVVVGHGRDAVDVALTTSYGASRLNQMTVWADQVVDECVR